MGKKTFFCIDAHTCGNPVRVVAGGGPILKGANMSEKRQFFLKKYDWIRKSLMFEPRGHDMMSGSILYPPHFEENDIAVLFIETSGCLPMCGHGTIGTITIGIEEGLIEPKVDGFVRVETPAGLVEIEYYQKEKKVEWVKLKNVPSFLAADSLEISCPSLGELVFDVSYGGNYYAIIDPQKNFSGVENFSASELIRFSQVLRKKMNEKYPDKFVHPTNFTIRDISHILWTGKAVSSDSSLRNAVFYGDKAIDRSPCGTGTSAKMAQLHAKNKLKLGESFVNESFIGSKFVGLIEKEIMFEGKQAIIPSIKGWAEVFGYNTIIVDSNDPYANGFQVI